PKNNYLSFRNLFFGFLIALTSGTVLYMQEDINALFSLNDQRQELAAVKNNIDNKPVTKDNKKELATKDASGSTSNNPDAQENNDHPPKNDSKPTGPMILSAPDPSESKLTGHHETTTNRQIDTTNQEVKQIKTGSVIDPVSAQESPVSETSSYLKVQALLPDTVHREDWLLKQQGKYTVRLLGTLKEKIITTYINENIAGKKFAHEISYYLTEKQGKYKHSLLYGVFPTYIQAKGAIKNLPGNLKMNSPWPVKLDDIKKSITIYSESKLVDIKKPAFKAVPANKQPKIAATKATNGANISSKNETEALLQDKDSDSYTVQLLSTSSKKPLLSYMQKYNLEDKSVLYKTTRNDEDWYVLFYGVFKTRKMAESFINNLPKNARSGGPWIRKMSDLQKGFRVNGN
ncbi:MAG: SPOR domain-containing protein, partial [Gammaproteobacteria bacterium]|nr:SPOR domain-containing protein [Gammaproteobacteria bacterium]